VTVFLIGHVTKRAPLPGRRILEHIVDTVLYLKVTGSSHTAAARREEPLGATSEWGCSRCGRDRMVEVSNPSEASWPSAWSTPRLGDCGNHGRHTSAAGEIQGINPRPRPADFGNPRAHPWGRHVNRLLLTVAVPTAA